MAYYLGDEITWCDCPEPSDGIDKDDVTKYVRADIHGKLEQQLSEAQDNLLKKEAENDKLDGLNMAFDLNDKEQQKTIDRLRNALESKDKGIALYKEALKDIARGQLQNPSFEKYAVSVAKKALSKLNNAMEGK